MSFGLLEAGIVALAVVGAVRGFKRGLVREGMAFVGLIAGLALGAEWYLGVAGFLKPFVGGGRWVEVLAYLLVVMAALMVATLVTVLIQRLMRLFLVGWLDRLGGAVFGAGQGVVLAMLLLFLIVSYPFAGLDQVVKDSDLAMGLLGGLPKLVSYLPPDLGPVSKFFTAPRTQ